MFGYTVYLNEDNFDVISDEGFASYEEAFEAASAVLDTEEYVDFEIFECDM